MNIRKIFKPFKTSNLLLLITLLIPAISYAQYQENIPKPSGPVDLSKTSNVVIFIVIPVVILIVYLIFRKRIIKVKKDKFDRMK
ncbi:hypothetical protein [Algoriphagus chordae]|uniref:Adenylosuccinate synthetase n=1 Tax=Algoriphagus chordae TaxID=237019 RepID=A0A2W7STK1_9BACT|nr:hypothetical protein [Algoriphagus chordae]PZX54042.1 hypothetical protein LV85_01381 [Algoriphagus chordae]